MHKLLLFIVLLNGSVSSTPRQLWRAAALGNIEIIRKCIFDEGVDVNIADKWLGMTALMDASYAGNLEAVKYLIETCDADINCKSLTGDNALMIAIKYAYNFDLVKYLIDKRIDLSAVNNEGDTASVIALKYKQWHVLRYMLQYARSKMIFSMFSIFN